jgi:hypothetical protein
VSSQFESFTVTRPPFPARLPEKASRRSKKVESRAVTVKDSHFDLSMSEQNAAGRPKSSLFAASFSQSFHEPPDFFGPQDGRGGVGAVGGVRRHAAIGDENQIVGTQWQDVAFAALRIMEARGGLLAALDRHIDIGHLGAHHEFDPVVGQPADDRPHHRVILVELRAIDPGHGVDGREQVGEA